MSEGSEGMEHDIDENTRRELVENAKRLNRLMRDDQVAKMLPDAVANVNAGSVNDKNKIPFYPPKSDNPDLADRLKGMRSKSSPVQGDNRDNPQ